MKQALRRMVLTTAVDHLSPESLLVRRGPSRRRQVALTFDDGPDSLTRGYLDVLDRYGARATFFVVGAACEERREDLLETTRRGHEVASHGFSHRRLTELTRAEIDEELTRSAAALPPSRTPRPLVRPPNGATSPRSLLWCALAGYTTVLWSLNSEDWHLREPAEIADRLKPTWVRPGDIVLLHEGQQWTLDALPRILQGLKDAGYEMVTVGEMLES